MDHRGSNEKNAKLGQGVAYGSGNLLL